MKKSFVFPGQGSQKVGMGKEIYESFRTAKDVFEEVNNSLSKKLSDIIFNGPQEKLTLTENAQPAIMTISMAVIKVLEIDFKVNLNEKINYFAGHSLGEYTALAAAKSLSLSDVAKILFFRGENMQKCTNKNKTAMAAFMGADISKIKDIANKFSSKNMVCDIANYNTDNQIVLSGDENAIEEAMCEAKKQNIKALRLAVSAPFHSSYMKDTAQALKEEFQKYIFDKPKVKIISNVGARPFIDEKHIIDSLVIQTYSTVRWYESIKYMQEKNINTFYEIGFGKTLCGIIKRIDRKCLTKGVCDPVEIENLVKEII